MTSSTNNTAKAAKLPNEKTDRYRRKKGQCIYCGIQTHDVVQKFCSGIEKYPISVPGSVDNGRCLKHPQQHNGDASQTEVDGDDAPHNNGRTRNLISRRTAVKIAGAIVVGVGIVLTFFGLPGGEALVNMGGNNDNEEEEEEEPQVGAEDPNAQAFENYVAATQQQPAPSTNNVYDANAQMFQGYVNTLQPQQPTTNVYDVHAQMFQNYVNVAGGR